jgi:hypothetical protein
MVAPMISVTLSLDASELERDLERIDNGELELPTVSAVVLNIGPDVVEYMPIYLDEESCGC